MLFIHCLHFHLKAVSEYSHCHIIIVYDLRDLFCFRNTTASLAVKCQSTIKLSHDTMAEQQFCFNQGEKKSMILTCRGDCRRLGWFGWVEAGQVLGLLRELEVTLPYKSHSAG